MSDQLQISYLPVETIQIAKNQEEKEKENRGSWCSGGTEFKHKTFSQFEVLMSSVWLFSICQTTRPKSNSLPFSPVPCLGG